MNTALWIIQGVLAAMYILAGIMKATQPVEKLGKQMTWVPRHTPGMVRFIGAAELLGGIGLVVPWITGILPVLTPLAACGIGLIMILAAFEHISHKEIKEAIFNVVILAMCAFVAYGRFS
jgi:uncharacterized membrane protein YphA (DoxX/SURF4 family)